MKATKIVFVLILIIASGLYCTHAHSEAVPGSKCCDINSDDFCNSTDALIILSYDVGFSLPAEYLEKINAGCGDLNKDGSTNSTDALIILSWDVGFSVPFCAVDCVCPCPGTTNTPPEAYFAVGPTLGTISTTFHVDASWSMDNENLTSALQVRWDWEDDGIYDTGWDTTKTASHQYATIGTKTIELEVRDTGGLMDTVAQTIAVFPVECTTVTDTDNNEYETVQIGDQCWMAENLKVTHYRNGDLIPNITDRTEWCNLTTGAYCNVNNDETSVDTYGRLYNWYAVDDWRDIAPEGWHVPSDAEWKQLEVSLGMNQAQADAKEWRGTDEGGKMKTIGTIEDGDGLWHSPNTGATNESGFSAVPAGDRDCPMGYFHHLGSHAFFWSSTSSNFSFVWNRALGYDSAQVHRDDESKVGGYAVRCVRDY